MRVFSLQIYYPARSIFFMICMRVRVECVVAYTILIIKKAIISDMKG